MKRNITTARATKNMLALFETRNVRADNVCNPQLHIAMEAQKLPKWPW